MSMDRRLGKGDHPSRQINVKALRERLREERLRAAGIDVSDAIRRPTRLTLNASARRHLAAVAFLFVFVLGTLGVAFTADQWRNERNTTGYIRACVSCHGKINVDVPSVTP